MSQTLFLHWTLKFYLKLTLTIIYVYENIFFEFSNFEFRIFENKFDATIKIYIKTVLYNNEIIF